MYHLYCLYCLHYLHLHVTQEVMCRLHPCCSIVLPYDYMIYSYMCYLRCLYSTGD
jgi:hypothetical protein